ncbi:hypothetical protein M0802_012333 [Mischocyttarus mexicanus]|nr:hypothetical protein M0802_012333 [Mischocyttarus mexicanus]
MMMMIFKIPERDGTTRANARQHHRRLSDVPRLAFNSPSTYSAIKDAPPSLPQRPPPPPPPAHSTTTNSSSTTSTTTTIIAIATARHRRRDCGLCRAFGLELAFSDSRTRRTADLYSLYN